MGIMICMAQGGLHYLQSLLGLCMYCTIFLPVTEQHTAACFCANTGSRSIAKFSEGDAARVRLYD